MTSWPRAPSSTTPSALRGGRRWRGPRRASSRYSTPTTTQCPRSRPLRGRVCMPTTSRSSTRHCTQRFTTCRTPRLSRAGSAGRSARSTASPNCLHRRDLRQRLVQLPQNYSAAWTRAGTAQARHHRQRSATPSCGSREKARASTTRRGPKAHYLGPLHPVLDWASDRALTALGRNQVFVIRGDVDAPTVLLMGTLTNKRGQLISRVFSTAVFPNPTNPEFCVVEPLRGSALPQDRDGAEAGIIESWSGG